MSAPLHPRTLPPAEEWAESLRAGRIDWLSRALSLVENRRPEARERAEEVLQLLLPHTGRAFRLGLSGSPGVGKSSFIEAWGLRRAEAGQRVAVLAIDPSSSRTRGSILGDKTRMNRLSTHPNAYVRPSAAGATLGGVARATRESLLLCDAAGFDLIIVETVGVGQSETLVQGMVDCYLVLLQAGGGDELQGIKRGILELADHLLVTKADGENLPAARRAAADFRSAFGYLPPQDDGWRPEVGLCSAVEGTGLSELDSRLAAFEAHRRAAGSWERRRTAQRAAWFEEALGQLLADLLEARPELRAARQALRAEVEAKRTTPWRAARLLVGRLGAGA